MLYIVGKNQSESTESECKHKLKSKYKWLSADHHRRECYILSILEKLYVFVIMYVIIPV
jgi:hypothetical protein